MLSDAEMQLAGRHSPVEATGRVRDACAAVIAAMIWRPWERSFSTKIGHKTPIIALVSHRFGGP